LPCLCGDAWAERTLDTSRNASAELCCCCSVVAAGGGAADDDQDNEAASSSDAADASDAGSEHDSGSEEGSASVSTADEADPTPPHPQAVLTGRPAGGFGLEFNPVRSGLLLGGDAEGGVQLWDVEGFCSNGSGSSGGGGGSSGGGAVRRIPPVQVRALCTIHAQSVKQRQCVITLHGVVWCCDAILVGVWMGDGQ